MQSFKLDNQGFSVNSFRINSKTIWLLLILFPLVCGVYILIAPVREPSTILFDSIGAAIIVAAFYSLFKKETFIPTSSWFKFSFKDKRIYVKNYYFSENWKLNRTDDIQKVPATILLTGKSAIYAALIYILFGLFVILLLNH